MASPFYFVDSNNIAIRKVDASGVITTVTLTSTNPIYLSHLADNQFSNPAAPSGFVEPWGMCSDPAGNLYVCDFGTSNVYKIDTSNVVTLVAGSDSFGYSGDGGLATSAELKNPWYVATDAAGNLYIADASILRIRAVNMQSTTQTLLGVSIPAGCIDTVAGTGSNGFSGDSGPAIAAELSAPIGLAVNAAGELFICDQTNNRVRKVDTSGIITTVVGANSPPGTDGFGGDGGPATAALMADLIGVSLDAAGNLYIADTFNYRTRAVNTQGTTQTLLGVSIAAGNINTVAGTGSNSFGGDSGPATSAQIAKSWFTAIDPAGNLYICDTYNYRIRRVDASTGIITTVVGNGVNGYTGDAGPATSAEISFVFGMAFPPAAPTTGNIVIQKVTDPTGSSQSFDFTSTYGSPFSLTDGQSNDSGQIAAGTYSVTEAAVDGWTTTTSQDPTAIVVVAGETTTVIFTNTQTPTPPPSTDRAECTFVSTSPAETQPSDDRPTLPAPAGPQTWVYDFGTRGWFQLQRGFTSLAVFEIGEGEQILVGGAEDGFVYVIDDLNGTFDFSGTCPQASFRPALIDFGDPSSMRVFKYLELEFTSDALAQDITVTYWLDPPNVDNPGTGRTMSLVKVRGADRWRAWPSGGSLCQRLLIDITVRASTNTGAIRGAKIVADKVKGLTT